MADEIPYIERLGDHWGDPCASREVASRWADRLMDDTWRALASARPTRAFFRGTSACLSALLASQRFDELMQLLATETFWPYKQWSVKALLAQGRKAEAVRAAEACRSPWTNDRAVDVMCEAILLSSGLAEEAYHRYGLRAHIAGSYAATFRAVMKQYPERAVKERIAGGLRRYDSTLDGTVNRWR